jgi:hypothetical protein
MDGNWKQLAALGAIFAVNILVIFLFQTMA